MKRRGEAKEAKEEKESKKAKEKAGGGAKKRNHGNKEREARRAETGAPPDEAIRSSAPKREAAAAKRAGEIKSRPKIGRRLAERIESPRLAQTGQSWALSSAKGSSARGPGASCAEPAAVSGFAAAPFEAGAESSKKRGCPAFTTSFRCASAMWV